MARVARQGMRGPFLYAWLIIAGGILTFALVVWARISQVSRPGKLETMIAGGAPFENAHALAIGADGTYLVGTDLGIITGKGSTWSRDSIVQRNILSVVSDGVGGHYLAGNGIGVARYAGGKLEPLLGGEVHALAVDPKEPEHLIAYVVGAGLMERRGQTWAKLGGAPTEGILSLTFQPEQNRVLVAGGLDGSVSISEDGGQTWRQAESLQGSVSALVFDPARPGRLWASAGGIIFYTDDQGDAWHQAEGQRRDQVAVALAFPPDGGNGPMVITAEGALFSVSD